MCSEFEYTSVRISNTFILKKHFQLAMSKKGEENMPYLYEIDGNEALGSYLVIYRCSDRAPEISECVIQWYRSTSEAGKKELISGKICYHFCCFCCNCLLFCCPFLHEHSCFSSYEHYFVVVTFLF